MAPTVFKILNPPLHLFTYQCQRYFYWIRYSLLNGEHVLFTDFVATLSSLRQNVTTNEKNIDTIDRTVAMLSSPTGGDTQTTNAMERLHQLEQANTSKIFLPRILIELAIYILIISMKITTFFQVSWKCIH